MKLDDITADNWTQKTASISDLLKNDFNTLKLSDEEIDRFKHGMRIKIDMDDQQLMLIDDGGVCLGFGVIETEVLKPKMVLI